ncbi:hypothetical protein [Paenibacillus senegalimassiliensis]|uniref:hypothetical protein n=1 Tax=Paenibacillus senegalimassiliensis TaxID=1737426 RepID=UPI00073E6F84|nr:hypothetical protein [Paenibacillus senegalimassiliensis]
MDLQEAWNVIVAAVLSVGGAGAIIIAISSWLGRIWATHIQEKDRKNYQAELEKLKASYINDLEAKKRDYEKDKILFARYTEHQFKLYNDLYRSLYDLKIVADKLWEKAMEANLQDFSKQLSETTIILEKSILLIEDKHYERLSELLDKFSSYKIGKEKLIDLRNHSTYSPRDEKTIRDTIEINNKYREEYSNIIKQIGILFKRQIKIGEN